MTRIPHPNSPTEVRQAFQALTEQAGVITTGALGEILIGQGVGVAPVWTTDLTALTLLTVDNISIDGATIVSDTGSISFGDENLITTGSSTAGSFVTGTLTVSAGSIIDSGGTIDFDDENLNTTGLINGVDLDTMNTFFNGTFQETFDAVVTSDGATITMSLEQSGTGDLTMQFSDGYTTLDCTDPLQTIALTAGADDTSPQANYIYIPQSTKVLTKSTSSWPAGEHIRVAYFLVPSAAFVQSKGCYINQNWNDHLASVNSQGHMAHMSEKLRRLGASWFSGVNANGATASYFTIGAGTTDWLSTSGEIDQLHEHTFPAVETSGSDIVLVVNQNGTAYDDIADLFSIVNDNTGAEITNNKYFNLVFWGVVNKSGEFAALMVNLPGGFYTRSADALIDADGHDVYDIPREFSIDSGTAFLICRATFQMGGTWSHVATTDLRGQNPYTAGGTGVNDHGGLGGLLDDDHTQYLLVDGTRNLTGNLALSAGVTIDGRELSTDGTKLDGIESLADVTDATNVAAAGAAMSGGVFHDGFSDFVGDEHIDWTGASVNLVTTGTVDASKFFNSAGDLEIQEDTQGDVYFFRGTNVGDEDDGGKVYIYRNAAEGNSFFVMYVNDISRGVIETSAHFEMQAGAHIKLKTGSNIFLDVGDAGGTYATIFRDSSSVTQASIDSDGNAQFNGNLDVGAEIFMDERSTDPTEPTEGQCVIWMSDGTGKGDDGDIMIASKAGGTTNYGTLFDHSGGAAW